MDCLPTNVEEYNSKLYWEKRFTAEEEYDWLCSYDKYGSILESLVSAQDQILVLGTVRLLPYSYYMCNIISSDRQQ